jgi:hypothetical protein
MENTIKDKVYSEAYDYIVNTVITQKRLLGVNELYGDGTRWEMNYYTFCVTYYTIKAILEANKLI